MNIFMRIYLFYSQGKFFGHYVIAHKDALNQMKTQVKVIISAINFSLVVARSTSPESGMVTVFGDQLRAKRRAQDDVDMGMARIGS
ncbi:hypothetical protein Lsha_0641 [Legionella shakespearei DSM 23087]|uniref:Uncharacterized protein n=1 Tax=Legionella shakespearei DSM 23087 TaxID=1122169 RepID=A0A0W0Z517_9GAMM|nr:hypothetical protein Lsha_0641 [Legionella shakespearei DSM 23087]